MYVESTRRRLGTRALTVFVASLMAGACAPVAVVDPDVTIDFQMKENPSLASSYLLAELPEDTTFPVVVPRAYQADQLCLLLSVTGPGTSQAFAEVEDFSCTSRFPGIGVTSEVFAWGEKPSIKVEYGDRQFDVMGFP